MVLRLFLFLLGYGVLLAVPGAGLAYIGYLALKPRFNEWLARRLAARHAQQLQLEEGRRCSFCLEPCDEQLDCWQNENGWFHSKCLKALLG